MINEEKKSKKPLVVIVIILLVALGVAGWFIFNNVEKSNKEHKKEKDNNTQLNAYDEYNKLDHNGLKIVLYCEEDNGYCYKKEEDVFSDNYEKKEYSCVGKTDLECFYGKREDHQDSSDRGYNKSVLTDSGYIVLVKDNYAYKCENKDCIYINDEYDTLFVYDGEIYLVDYKNNKKTKLDIKYEEVFKGYVDDSSEPYYDDGTIEYLKEEKLPTKEDIENYDDDEQPKVDKNIIIYTSTDGGQSPYYGLYYLNNGIKTEENYPTIYCDTFNGNNYIFASTAFFTDEIYAHIIDKTTGKIIKEFNDADTFINDEANKQILVAEYKGMSESFESTYKIKYKLNYNLEEIK